MSTEKSYRGLFAIGAIISIAAVVIMMIVMPAGFWIFLPFAVAFTGKALDII
jgi:hypothetical protein